jgi:hypothetical protein
MRAACHPLFNFITISTEALLLRYLADGQNPGKQFLCNAENAEKE